MNSIRTRLRLRAMESQRYWQFRSSSQRRGTTLNTARIATAARAADFTALILIGGRALSKSTQLIIPPLLVLVFTQSIVCANGLWAAWITNLPNWIEQCLTWFASSVPNAFDAAALPTAAISVAVVFVAVYFATVTFVVSTTYKDATKKLRDQIVRQPKSRWHVGFFTQAVVFVALTLGVLTTEVGYGRWVGWTREDL